MTNQTQLPIAQLNPEDLVFVSQTKELVTDSFLVAKYFNKRHYNISQKIRNLGCSREFTERNFSLCHKNNELQNNKIQPFYQMTKDGFMFLVMSFTGKKAAIIKEAYINAFNWMAEKLQSQKQNLPAVCEDLFDLNDLNFRMLIEFSKGGPKKVKLIEDDAFICNKERLIELMEKPWIFSDADLADILQVAGQRLRSVGNQSQLPAV